MHNRIPIRYDDNRFVYTLPCIDASKHEIQEQKVDRSIKLLDLSSYDLGAIAEFCNPQDRRSMRIACRALNAALERTRMEDNATIRNEIGSGKKRSRKQKSCVSKRHPENCPERHQEGWKLRALYWVGRDIRRIFCRCGCVSLVVNI